MRKFLLGLFLGLLVPVLGALIAAKLGFFSVYATEEPPAWEMGLARMAADASVARSALRLSNPIVSNDEELIAGMKLYRAVTAMPVVRATGGQEAFTRASEQPTALGRGETIRSPMAIQSEFSTVASSCPSAHAAGHRRGQKEKRSHRCQQDRRRPAL